MAKYYAPKESEQKKKKNAMPSVKLEGGCPKQKIENMAAHIDAMKWGTGTEENKKKKTRNRRSNRFTVSDCS